MSSSSSTKTSSSVPVDLTADSQPDNYDDVFLLGTSTTRVMNSADSKNQNQTQNVSRKTSTQVDISVRRKRSRSYAALQSREDFPRIKKDAIDTTLHIIQQSSTQVVSTPDLKILVENAVAEHLISNPDVIDKQEIAEDVHLTLFGEMPGLNRNNNTGSTQSLPVHKLPRLSPDVQIIELTVPSSSSSSSSAVLPSSRAATMKSPLLSDGFMFVSSTANNNNNNNNHTNNHTNNYHSSTNNNNSTKGSTTAMNEKSIEPPPVVTNNQRKCLNCNRIVNKSNNCNLVKCPCGSSQCFLCREDISAVKAKHFCQIVMCTHRVCGGCQLFSDADDDDDDFVNDVLINSVSTVIPLSVPTSNTQNNTQTHTTAKEIIPVTTSKINTTAATVASGIVQNNNNRYEDPVLVSAPPILTPQEEILIIFPNADIPHVNGLLVQYMSSVPLVVQDMIEKGYPKHKRESLSSSSSSSSSSSARVPKDFASTSWDTSPDYRDCAILVLCNLFPFIRKESMHRHFAMYKYRYSVTIESLETELKMTAGSVTKQLPGGQQFIDISTGMTKLGLNFKQPA